MTALTTTLARLGLVLHGTNEDLTLTQPVSSKSEGEESEDDQDSEESEDDQGQGSSDGDPEESDDTDGDSNGDEDPEEGEEEDPEEGEEEDAQGSAEGDPEEGEESDDVGSSDGDPEEGEESDDVGSSDGDPEEGEDDQESDSDEEDGDAEPGEGSGDAEGDSEGEEAGDADGSPGEPSDGGDEEGEEDSEPEEGEGDSGEGSEEGNEGSSPAGMNPEELKTLAEELIEAIMEEADTGLVDNNEALGEALGDKADEAVADCEDGEQVWRPYYPDLDLVEVVTGGDATTARRMKSKVLKEISFLRAQLRNKFLQARTPKVLHGVRKGNDLSDRRLVNSVIELRSGRRPTRPDWKRIPAEDCSLAAAVVLDQSSSMGKRLAAKVGAAAIAIATPLDELGAPCLVIGPRDDNRWTPDVPYGAMGVKYHRDETVTIDVFKDWEEPMRVCLDRFSKVQSTGGTPLSDGIQYAMQYINERSERHRVILVITDGLPNCGDVVRRQIRLAKEAGVTVVGVGISDGCYAVKYVFPENHVAVDKLEKLPKELLRILSDIMFPKKAKRIVLDQ